MANYTRRDIRGGAAATTITAGINSSVTSITIASSSGWPDGSAGDFFVVIDRGTASEEKVRIASRTTTTLTVQTSGRGSDGTTAASHSSGAAIEHCISAIDIDEANYTTSKTVGKVTAVGQLLVGDGANSLAALNNGTSGLPLVAGASTPAYGTLGAAALAADSVTATQIATDAVGSAEIAALAVGSAELAADSVITAKILDANVTTAKIADANVTAAKLAAAVAGDGLAGGAGTALSVNVDASTIETNSDTLRVKDGGITGAKLASNVADASTIEVSATTLRLKDAGITSAKFNSEAGTAWTPTVSGTGWGLVNGTVTGLYIKHGRRVLAQAKITFGSSSTFGSGSLTIGGLPVAMNASIDGTGRVFINDASASKDYYADWAVLASGTSGIIYASAEFTAPDYIYRVACTSTIPMTWANGDSITLVLDYIAVS